MIFGCGFQYWMPEIDGRLKLRPFWPEFQSTTSSNFKRTSNKVGPKITFMTGLLLGFKDIYVTESLHETGKWSYGQVAKGLV